MSTDVRGIVWLDYNGKSRLTTPRADTSLSSIQSALLAHSNAVVSYYWEGAQTAVGGSPVAATFQSVGDSVRLMFQDASCDQVSLILPAPKADIFFSDGETVDPSTITDITSACLGHLQTSAGNVVTDFLGGFRQPRGTPP